MLKKRKPLKRKRLKGSFDLYITNACNLSCKNCSVLDYKGEVTIPHLNLKDIQEIISNLSGYIVEELKVLGGEPTTHKEFGKIVDFIVSQKHCYEKLTLITNGLNFKPEIVEKCKHFDKIWISEYPSLGWISEEIKKSPVYNKLTEHSEVYFHTMNKFQLYGEKKPGVEYSTKLNWERCWQKDSCRALTKDGVYRCVITMNEKTEIYDWKDLNSINKDVPLKRCETCYWFPKEERWSSRNIKKDTRNYANGIKVIEI